MFAPEQWPAYYREARGVEVIDISGNRYVDMSLSGILACILGYADPDVNAAVRRRVDFGSMATLQTADEGALCDKLIEIHPWAEMVRLARTGGESMTIAVRLARAATGRDHVLVCGYHGWHDWYLAANLGGADQLDGHLLPGLEPAGVPKGLAGTTGTFRYNRLDDLDAVLAAHAGKVAAIVMEPTRHTPPQPGFLEAVRERANDAGIVLIFDEISVGWRFCLGGAHRHFGVSPDMAVFAKSLSNGYAMAAVIGRGEVMQAAQSSFISSTYWTEGIGPVAALATISKLQRLDVPAHLARIGKAMMSAWTELGDRHGVPVTVRGPEQLPAMSIDHPQADALATLFIARMLRRGFLASTSFSPTYAHQLRHVDAYREAAEPVFAELAEAIERSDAEDRIGGAVKHRGFTRLT
jgi:glutamate-1-semialdehyde 2,1-aminomutase